jgi:D-glycero-D-manno-heptose 1,7-bisphosphate phosphatase
LRKAVFFDRDGVLNELINRDGGLYSPQSLDQFKIYDNAKDVVGQLRNKGFLSIVVSNQPDIARGKLNKKELNEMTKLLVSELMIDDVFYCYHDDEDECLCRKPLPGLLIQAKEKWNINMDESFMVGDTWKDGDAANRAKVNFFLLDKNYNLDYKTSKRIDSLEDIFELI